MCVWFIITPFQYFLAYFFFIKIPAYKYIKFMVFLPYVISSTVIGFLQPFLFNPNIGLMNTILKKAWECHRTPGLEILPSPLSFWF